MSAIANLEYLFINNIKLCGKPFENLHKLIKITIFHCDLSEFDFKYLDSLTSLETIEITDNSLNPIKIMDIIAGDYNKTIPTFTIDLNKFINLKRLSLFIENVNLELITSSQNQLTEIEVLNKTVDFSKKT